MSSMQTNCVLLNVKNYTKNLSSIAKKKKSLEKDRPNRGNQRRGTSTIFLYVVNDAVCAFMA